MNNLNERIIIPKTMGKESTRNILNAQFEVIKSSFLSRNMDTGARSFTSFIPGMFKFRERGKVVKR